MPIIAGETKGDIYKGLLREYKACSNKATPWAKYLLKNIKDMEKNHPEWCF